MISHEAVGPSKADEYDSCEVLVPWRVCAPEVTTGGTATILVIIESLGVPVLQPLCFLTFFFVLPARLRTIRNKIA